MPSFRSLIQPGQRVIKARLTQLQENFQTLGERLRSTVLQLLSDNLGQMVRDAFQETLGGVARSPAHHSSYHRRQGWDEPDYYWGQSPEADGWHDEFYPSSDFYDEDEFGEPDEIPQQESPSPSRMTSALASGFRAVAWALRRWPGRNSWLSVTGWGLAVCCAAYFGGSLTAVGLSLMETSDHLAVFG